MKILFFFLILAAFNTISAQDTHKNEKSLSEYFKQIIADSGTDGLINTYNEIKTSVKTEYNIDENELIDCGYDLLRKGKIGESIAVLKIASELMPESWNVWNCLGDAYWTADQLREALSSYKESLRLNAGNANAQEGVRILTRSVYDIDAETKIPSRFAPMEKTRIKGCYLGQEPPGQTPKIFAEGIISTSGNFEFGCTFSPDGKEFYFTRRPEGEKNRIMISRISGNCWAAPSVFDSSDYYMENEPYITPDGSKLFFGSYRIIPGSSERKYAVWYKEKAETGWGEAKFFDVTMYVSAAADGNIYATDISTPQSRGIIKYKHVNGNYEKPVKLQGEFISRAAHPCIAPDESYIIFDWEPESDKDKNLPGFYLSFNKGNDKWGDPIFLGEMLGSDGILMCAYISPDGKYLFYSTHKDIYWIGTDFINELRPIN